MNITERHYKTLLKPDVCITVFTENWFKVLTKPFPPICDCCRKEIKPYSKKYYGITSNYIEMLDVEYSHETGFCEACAITKATETMNRKHFIDYSYVVKQWDTPYGTHQEFSDGSICEETEASVAWASQHGTKWRSK